MNITQPKNITFVPLSMLRPWKNNARTHSRKQVRQIVKSIQTFGFTNPILIDGDNNILAGHGRALAAGELGMEDVPCLRIEYMSDDQKRAYVLADNKLALNAGWDEDLLALELGELFSSDVEFDLDVIGFSVAEIDTIFDIAQPEEPSNPVDDIIPDDAKAPKRVKAGDIWALGSHRLICGDALNP